MPLAPYQMRVMNEVEELRVKMDKLRQFVQSSKFDQLPIDEQKRLLRQSLLMSKYADVLDDRIAHFVK
jgi:hypothetical protein